MNCAAIEGNGNANLFLASRDVCVCSSKSYHIHHERYFDVISSMSMMYLHIEERSSVSNEAALEVHIIRVPGAAAHRLGRSTGCHQECRPQPHRG